MDRCPGATGSETVKVGGPLKANSSLALRQALLQGLGIAAMPLFVVGEDLARSGW